MNRYGDATMIRSMNSRSLLSLLAAMAMVLALAGRAPAQQPVEVLHKTIKVGDPDIFHWLGPTPARRVECVGPPRGIDSCLPHHRGNRRVRQAPVALHRGVCGRPER
jgi:hypothetical protein